MSLLKILGDKFIMYSTTLARGLGIDEAIFVGELARKYNYWEINNKLTDDGFFYISHEDIENDTCLSKHRQIKATKNLVDFGIIEIKQVGGMNRSNYYRVNEQTLEKYFYDCQESRQSMGKNLDIANCRNSTLQSAESEPSKLQNLDTTNTINTNTTTNTTNKETNYEKGKRLKDTKKEIIDYFNSLCGTKFNVKGTGKNLDDLLESYSIEEIKKVIEFKYKEWGEHPFEFKDHGRSTGEWSTKNLTPFVIFKLDNFNKYFEQAIGKKDRLKTPSVSVSAPLLKKSGKVF